MFYVLLMFKCRPINRYLVVVNGLNSVIIIDKLAVTRSLVGGNSASSYYSDYILCLSVYEDFCLSVRVHTSQISISIETGGTFVA